MVDDQSYFSGRYVMAGGSSANLPVRELAPTVHSREAVELHLKEVRSWRLFLQPVAREAGSTQDRSSRLPCPRAVDLV